MAAGVPQGTVFETVAICSRSSPKSKMRTGHSQGSQHRDWMTAQGRSSSYKTAAREA